MRFTREGRAIRGCARAGCAARGQIGFRKEWFGYGVYCECSIPDHTTRVVDAASSARVGIVRIPAAQTSLQERRGAENTRRGVAGGGSGLSRARACLTRLIKKPLSSWGSGPGRDPHKRSQCAADKDPPTDAPRQGVQQRWTARFVSEAKLTRAPKCSVGEERKEGKRGKKRSEAANRSPASAGLPGNYQRAARRVGIWSRHHQT